jgi:beta-1,4-mannosyl-glycoprotein beta-1,4-N-acetylglucosaminyltransferase
MLKYRLTFHYAYIDYFILVESTHTFVGAPKPCFYNDNKELFKEFSDKIIHILVEDTPFKNSPKHAWDNEAFQRNCIKRGIDKLDLHDDDILFLSDVDEILDANRLTKYAKETPVEIHDLAQVQFMYNLNFRSTVSWYDAKMLSYKTYRELSKTFDEIRKIRAPDIWWGGWHMSSFGSKEFIQTKMMNFSHQEYNTPEHTNLDIIEENMKKGIHFCNHDLTIARLPIQNFDYPPPQYEKFPFLMGDQ